VLVGGFVLLGDGAYLVGGGSFGADHEGSSCAGVSSVERFVEASVLGPELVEGRSAVTSLPLPDHEILELTAVSFSRTSCNTVLPSVPSSAST
jgi:hypothetical protein